MRLRRSRRRFRYLDLCPFRDPDLCRSRLRLRRCSPSPIKRESILSSGLRVCICTLAPTKLKLSFVHTDLLSAACLGICVCGVRYCYLGIFNCDPAYHETALLNSIWTVCRDSKGSCVTYVPEGRLCIVCTTMQVCW